MNALIGTVRGRGLREMHLAVGVDPTEDIGAPGSGPRGDEGGSEKNAHSG
jgi:hypothetical protein